MITLSDMHLPYTGPTSKNGVLWHINPEQLESNRKWYAEYQAMLSCGAAPEAAYDFANLVLSGANDMEIIQTMMDALSVPNPSAVVAVDSQRDEPGYYESTCPYLY